MAFTPTEEAQLRAVIEAFESGKTISEIAASTEVFTTDALEVIQEAVSKKATIAQIVTLVNSELGISTISSKLSGIAAGAQVNAIESVKVNNTVLPISSKSVNITVPTQPIDIGAEPALGFTPEQAGVAESLVTALKNGVSTEGNTLKKLYDLILASFSEVQVTTIAARDAYNITKLPTNVFVLDDGDSKWALYKATTTGVNATYVKLSDPDLLNAVMTASQIAISYESVDDVNRFTDALKAKLDAFTANFTVELKAAYDGKQNSLTIGNLTSTTSGVTIGNGTGAVIGSGATVNIATAGASSDGILTSGHFNTFNNKVSNATHTGDVTGSTALTLATVNSNIGTFNNVTINAKGLATSGSNVGYLTGITSGQVTTALGYTPKPTFTENTAFNKNFGTTTGTVLEGRTFGTAANSAVGDFIQNQNLSPQSSNAWLTGTIKSNSSISVIKDGSNTVGGGSFVGISNSSDSKQSIIQLNADAGLDYWFYNGSSFNKSATLSNDGYFNAVSGYKLNGNNLFNSITSNATPLWDGSKFINSSLSGYQSYPALYLPIYPDPFLTNSVITGNYTGTGSPNKSLIITDAANRPVALFDNSGRLDLKDYSGHGGLAVLYNMAEPVVDQLIGHYAWASRNSAGHLATTNLIKAVLTNTSETSMSSQLRLDYMHNCNTAGIYAEPNQGISIDGNGFTLPNIPFISEVGDQRFAGAISVTGKIKSNHDVAVVKDGSDAIAQGAYLNLSNTSDSKQVLLQLNGSGGIDYWFNNGTSFNKVSSMSNTGVVTASSFSGSGSNLTGVQLPITLTTNGTSGAATKVGDVINIPNYSSNSVYQTQTTVNGSTGGNMVCSMPFQTGSYKKVMIRFSSLSGNASYSYPTVFTTQPSISSIYQQVGTTGTYTTGGAGASAFTITGASGLSGWIFIEGY